MLTPSRRFRTETFWLVIVSFGDFKMKTRHQARLTRFQQRVYAVVRRIPKGEVRSYRWVARQLGNANLARAVSQALARNPSPHRVPCHRVIRTDGRLGGYAWGVAKKRRLLTQEASWLNISSLQKIVASKS